MKKTIYRPDQETSRSTQSATSSSVRAPVEINHSIMVVVPKSQVRSGASAVGGDAYDRYVDSLTESGIPCYSWEMMTADNGEGSVHRAWCDGREKCCVVSLDVLKQCAVFPTMNPIYVFWADKFQMDCDTATAIALFRRVPDTILDGNIMDERVGLKYKNLGSVTFSLPGCPDDNITLMFESYGIDVQYRGD